MDSQPSYSETKAMTKPPRKYDPPKSTAWDHAHTVARAGISAIPVGSGPAVELFNFLFAPHLQRRGQVWMELVAEGLRDLEEKQATLVDDLRNNEIFIDTMLQASQAAVRTSQQEKREALRNAVLNSALPQAPDASKQAMFIALLDSFTVWHLRLLRLFASPVEWYQEQGRQLPSYSLVSLENMMLAAYPELKDQKPFYDAIVWDFYHRALLNNNRLDVRPVNGVYSNHTTPLGNEFVAFLKTPLLVK